MRKLALTALLLSACGADSGGDKKAAQDAAFPSWAVADTQALPECTPALEGALVYVKATQGLQYCEAEKWVNAELDTPAETGPLFVERTECILAGPDIGPTVVVVVRRTAHDERWIQWQTGEGLIGGVGEGRATVYEYYVDASPSSKWKGTVEFPGNGGNWTVDISTGKFVHEVGNDATTYEDECVTTDLTAPGQ